MSVLKNKLFLLGILSCATMPAMSQNTPPVLPESKHKLVVIAHHGNHTNVPENTLASINEAVKYGVDYVRLDLRTTKDGYLVIHHDATVDRATNGNGRINALTWREIKKLQVYNNNHRTHRIPEFSEVLKLCKNRIHIYLDVQDADPGKAWKQIQEAGMEKQVVVYLNKKAQYTAWKEAAPQLPLTTSIPDDLKGKEQLAAFLDEVKIEVLDNVPGTDMDQVIKDRGISLWLDLQGSAESAVSWNNALTKGVQGLQTDQPEALIDYLNKKGLRNDEKK